MERINKSLQSWGWVTEAESRKKSQKRMWMEQRAWSRYGALLHLY